ncbi:MAG: LacI family DNA-binding transcriptional regulator [Smithellaceae bacterium]|nr:LacI family DNA-binding transcriptional regulator [Smithellaceae bacterium]
MPNILDVARRAKVSIATVSRVVNKSDHKVRESTKEKVQKAINELDYRPNALAKGLLMHKTMTIGIIIPDISNPYYAEIVRGIQDVADQSGYAVTLHNTDKRQEGIIRYIYLLREKSADGIIFSGGIINRYETLSILRELKDRVVVIGRHDVDFPAVMVDNMGGAAQAVEHLIALGHRRIGFIGGPDGSTTAADRLCGYRTALARNGLHFEKRLVRKGDWNPQSGYLQAATLLEGRARPTAILTANDMMAFGVIKAARARGLTVPSDVAVAGFDNIPLSSYFDPSLTTVEVPMYQLGAASIKTLIDLLAGNNYDKLKMFETKLLVRESTLGGVEKRIDKASARNYCDGKGLP